VKFLLRQKARQYQGRGGVKNTVAARYAQDEIPGNAGQTKNGSFIPDGAGFNPPGSFCRKTIGDDSDVVPPPGDFRDFAGAPVIRAVNKNAADGKFFRVFNKSVPYIDVFRVIILMIAFHAGKHNTPRMKSQKMPPVLAGFGDKVFIPQAERGTPPEGRAPGQRFGRDSGGAK
jgi:hypothetical protein